MSRPLFELPDTDYSAYIFDCDGTLADSMPLHQRAWRFALAAHGATFEFSWDLFMRRAGMTLEKTVEELNVEFDLNLDPLLVARDQRAYYEALMDAVEPIHEVVAFARAKAGRYPLSVASGGERSLVLRTLQNICVEQLFPVVVVAADVKRGKPDPEMFLLAAEKMGVPAEKCLVFEDSPACARAAEQAGMGAVLVTRPAPQG